MIEGQTVDNAESGVVGGGGGGDKRKLAGGGDVAVETHTLARHRSVGRAVAVVVATGADVELVVGALHHAADGEGNLLAVLHVGHMVPGVEGIGERFGHCFGNAQVVVEVAENLDTLRSEEQTASGGTRIESVAACVLTVDDDARNLAADVVGSDFIEFAGLGVRYASSQSQKAYIQAEKYFVSFHKILIIN